MKNIPKPNPGEYPAYAERYMKWIPDDGNLLGHLQQNFEAVKSLVNSLPESRHLYRYAEGKWTIKEILVHIIDNERIFANRALRFARNDRTPLPGYEQDDYVPYSGANDRDMSGIMEEYEAVRKATITLFAGLPAKAIERTGTASGSPYTVRALGYFIAGHEMHHLNIIKEKYKEGFQ